MKRLFFVVVILIALIFVGIFTWGRVQKEIAKTPKQVACTMEAKICPEGSAVGRTGPNCEFALCPTATTTPDAVSFGEIFEKDSIRVIPQELLEDSRCPLDVQCIQAGTVRVSVILDAEGEQKTMVMTQGTPVTFVGRTVLLVSTLPAPNSKVTIRKKEYQFTFSIALKK